MPATASKTSISDLSPDVDYTVTILAYAGSEESLPISGQITQCSVSAIADLVFLVDGSWSVGRPNFKFIQKFISVAAGAFQIGAERTRVGVASGARKAFPKVLVIITDGKSEDPVENYARRLRSRGVEIFVLGIQQANEEQMKLMASEPHRSHIFSVADFNLIKSVQSKLVSQVCAGVDNQLNSLVSGEEVVEPASNLQILEVASKSLRLMWDASIGEVSGYKVQMIPMMAGSKRQELYVGPTQTQAVVRDLSPDTEYEISLFALNGLMPSEPLTLMQKTQLVKVSLECSLGVDVQADVVLLVDGSYSIGLANFAKVRAFLEVLVTSFDIGPDKVQISLVQYSRDPHTEFYLNTHHDQSAVVKAVRSFPYRGGSTNTGRAMTYGARPNVPRINILITDGKSSDAFHIPATNLRNADVEIFAVGVKDAVRRELEAIANEPAATHVYTIGSRSFRAAWEMDATDVESYLVRFRPVNGDDGHVSMSVPGETLTAVLPHLTPLTSYEVNVQAQYNKGNSFPVTGFETTLEERGSVQNLRVSEETTDSFRVSWQPAQGDVTRYKLTYEPVGDERSRLETTTAGRETAIVLQELQPKTKYPKGSPRDLRVFEETVSSMKVSWEPAPGSVQQYRVSYQPSAGGPRKEVAVKGDNRAALLKNLQPGTQYEISLIMSCDTFVSECLIKVTCPAIKEKSMFKRHKTSITNESKITKTKSTIPLLFSELGPPKNLVTSDVTESSFKASWTAAPGNVKMYRIRWKSLFSAEAGDKTVPGDETETVLEASAAGKSLAVSEETERSMRVSWTPAPGKVAHYRLKYSPIGGGKEMLLKVPGTSSSTVMKRLQPTTTYTITVNPIYKRGEGKARQGVGTTLSPYKAPRNLQTSEPTKTSFRVTWDPSPGEVKGYKVTFHPDGNDIDLGELLVGPYDNTVGGTKYTVAVFGMFDGGESVPLAGEENTTLMDDPDSPPCLFLILPPLPHCFSAETKCKTTAKADLVLLVDGSWSIGRINFKTIRNFIARMYSGDPKTEWHLNAHRTKASLLVAIEQLPYKGGNTMTGMALNFILQENFKTSVGMREDARKIGILITDGKSQDEIVFTSQSLRESGIELYAVGVKNADEGELRSIASDPDDIHMYNVNDFKFLVDIGQLDGPDGPVDMYRVTYRKVAGEEMLELLVDGTVNSVVLTGLSPLTEYLVNVHSILDEVSSEPLKGTETTLPLSAVKNMNVYDETSTTMKVRWGAAEGATGYMMLYRATNATEPQLEQEVRVGGEVTDVQLVQLTPSTAYSISLYALHGEAASDALEGTGVTCDTMKLRWDAAPGAVRRYIVTYKPDEGDLKEAEVDGNIVTLDLSGLISQTEYDVADLQFSEVTQTSFRTTWQHGAPDVALYRIGWNKRGEQNPEFAILNSDETSHVLQNLDPYTEYSVTVTAIYPDGPRAKT
ncbi:hypothetical protein F7725_020029 [Dissostichus mawsoni]|uniref:Collagen, type XII, alpha 1b n=1 Tax=Dissostichus mawsoni TaxID=36200 RepID=A0A7J5YLR5_DISMA|nr:hypothetical protein F7725_020029 [Dissostichus mawsoni]